MVMVIGAADIHDDEVDAFTVALLEVGTVLPDDADERVPEEPKP